jgi:hypothetical protein
MPETASFASIECTSYSGFATKSKKWEECSPEERNYYLLYYGILTLLAAIAAFSGLIGALVIPIVVLATQRNHVDFHDTLRPTGQLVPFIVALFNATAVL